MVLHRGRDIDSADVHTPHDTSLESVSTGCDTEVEDVPVGVGTTCNHPSCGYGGQDYMDTNAIHYVCTKCTKGGTLTICGKCKALNAHYRHRKYMVLEPDG